MTDRIQFEVTRVDQTFEHRTVERELPDGSTMPEREPYSLIHCVGYDEDGNFHHAKIHGFEPYFYVPYDEIEDRKSVLNTDIKRYELYDEDGDEFESVRGERVVKAVARKPRDVSNAVEEYSKTWESDVDFATRFLIDNDITTGISVPATDDEIHVDDIEPVDCTGDLRVHYMDIEVEDRHGFPEDGTEEILCITAYDSHDHEYITWIQGEGEHTDYADESELHDADLDVRWFAEERAMLRAYISYVSGSRPAIITGWNVDDFDMSYLMDRCEHLNDGADEDDVLAYKAMSPVWKASSSDYFGPWVKCVTILDLLKAFKRQQYTEMDSYRLDAVAAEVVGETKETFVGRVGQLWEDDPGKLVDYNLRDVELCVEIDRRQDTLAFVREVKSFVGCQLADATIESTVCDRYTLAHLNGEKVLPRKGSQSEADDYTGATVFDAAAGVFEMVPTLDLKSLYPMSMLTLNASPETKVSEDFEGETIHSPNGIHFRTDQEAITAGMIENLLDEREAKKAARDEHDPTEEAYDVLDRQQTAIKVIMNSLYGVMAWSRFRLYDQDVAAAVTATGRGVIQYTGEQVEAEGYDVLYGDTDSVLLDLGDDYDANSNVGPVTRICFEIEESINAAYDDFAEEQLGADTHHFQIEFEKLYKRFFQGGKKKRYAGHAVWDEGKDVDSVSITGYQFKRSDASKITKRVQKEVLEMIVRGEDPEDVAEYVRSEIHDFDEREVALEEIGVPKGIGSPLYSYDADTHPARGAKYANLLLGTAFASGSKPKRYYIESVHPSFFSRVSSETGLDLERDPLYTEFHDNPRFICTERAEQLPPEVALDWDEMKRKTLKMPLDDILESIGIEWGSVEAGSSQSGLEAFL